MTDLWPRVEELVRSVERPARYINHEWGSEYKKDADFHFCMIYPDTYELGQANQAVRILVNAVNAQDGMEAQRAFVPAVDMCDAMRKSNVPLFSLESCAPVREFDAIGITLPHELAASNVLELLDLAGIALRASERGEDDPIVMGGGPCAFNPEPYALFFDVFNIGEGESALPEQLQVIRSCKEQGASRLEILRALAKLPGVYVPSFYTENSPEEAQTKGSWVTPLEECAPLFITKNIYKDFSKSSGWEPCVVSYAEVVHDRLNVEVLRGCARGCRFCQAGMMYRPVRERSAQNITESVLSGLAQTGYDEVSLTSLSTTDHSCIKKILEELNVACKGKGIRISIPSQRLDAFGVDMAHLIAGQKKGGLTFAPEAGTQRLRDVINKNVTEQDLFSAVRAAFEAGWRRCKLYFMIGLPTETDEDIEGIAHLAQQVYNLAREVVPPDQRGNIKIVISCALFVPKAQTPFQWEGQISPEEARRRIELLRSSIKIRAIDVNWHDPKTSFIEAAMSRGGRECAYWVERAWKNGARFDAWTELFNQQAWEDAAKEVGIDPIGIAQNTYNSDVVLPWSHISTGVSLGFLKLERERAYAQITTPDCTFDECSACGACTALSSENDLAGDRNE